MLEMLKTKLIFFLCVSMCLLSSQTHAACSGCSNNSYDNDCYNYMQIRSAPDLAPSLAIGTMVVIAVIAIVIQDNAHHHGHN